MLVSSQLLECHLMNLISRSPNPHVQIYYHHLVRLTNQSNWYFILCWRIKLISLILLSFYQIRQVLKNTALCILSRSQHATYFFNSFQFLTWCAKKINWLCTVSTRYNNGVIYPFNRKLYSFHYSNYSAYVLLISALLLLSFLYESPATLFVNPFYRRMHPMLQSI